MQRRNRRQSRRSCHSLGGQRWQTPSLLPDLNYDRPALERNADGKFATIYKTKEEKLEAQRTRKRLTYLKTREAVNAKRRREYKVVSKTNAPKRKRKVSSPAEHRYPADINEEPQTSTTRNPECRYPTDTITISQPGDIGKLLQDTPVITMDLEEQIPAFKVKTSRAAQKAARLAVQKAAEVRRKWSKTSSKKHDETNLSWTVKENTKLEKKRRNERRNTAHLSTAETEGAESERTHAAQPSTAEVTSTEMTIVTDGSSGYLVRLLTNAKESTAVAQTAAEKEEARLMDEERCIRAAFARAARDAQENTHLDDRIESGSRCIFCATKFRPKKGESARPNEDWQAQKWWLCVLCQQAAMQKCLAEEEEASLPYYVCRICTGEGFGINFDPIIIDDDDQRPSVNFQVLLLLA